ncbi:RsmB/NOP family class I SAM-dependent RNA methyltransferase [Ottowia thiooxydans]|uniref:RsmB/NOP family class I SAM-dependent RNA methyltransferase n=1 Tax=Ottowia thiooxydans TaxID=219182 RepID=UPI0004235B6D|nr:RsmB/NOP family class I SAM-dependent RNA methyltransferase [Ottowia thiooxydans]
MSPKVLLSSTTELLRLALTFAHPFDAVVQRFFREQRTLGPRERAVVADAAYAVLRRKRWFDHLANSGKGPRERRLALLALALQEPEDASRWASLLEGDEPDWLVRAVQAAKAPLSEWPAECRHNLPDWLVERLQAQVGEEFLPLADALLTTAPLDLRVNVLKEKRPQVIAELADQAIECMPTAYSPWGLRLQGKPSLAKLDAYQRGAIEVQDEGSQLLALLLDARRGEMVADFCAGAGGKTLAIGVAMRNTGRLYAFDTSAHRLQALQPRLAKSGLDIVYPSAIAHERDERLARLAGKMDRVLVDAPCSGLGTLRRSPDLKWRTSLAEVQALQQRQLVILSAAARLLKPGGRLIYATCSLLEEENEALALSFGAANRGFSPLGVAEVLNGLRVSQAENLCSSDGQYLRLWPHRHGTDGFFAAAWTRH